MHMHVFCMAQAMLMAQCADADVIITTALIPNRPAPELVKQEMVDAMRRGSVIVDLAAENGGNAACTQADKAVVTPNGVTCLGYTDLVSRLPTQATAAFGLELLRGGRVAPGCWFPAELPQDARESILGLVREDAFVWEI